MKICALNLQCQKAYKRSLILLRCDPYFKRIVVENGFEPLKCIVNLKIITVKVLKNLRV